jgi:hypothetical protein
MVMTQVQLEEISMRAGHAGQRRVRRDALPLPVDPCMIATAPAMQYPGRNPGSESWIR